VTRYYVNMAPSLAQMLNDPESELPMPEGWRLIGRYGPRFEQQECWIVEDENAGPEFEDFLVLPIFTMTIDNPDDPDSKTTVRVTDREIMQAP